MGNNMKRYQVFVSSTFTDLEIERSVVLKSILKLNCFPAGMELFPSASVEQFEYIKKLIDESDYYILVIGARYGDDRDGISFTEKEFDYAISKNVPVLAFLHEHPENIPAKFFEWDENKRRKLEKFKNKVINNRLVSFWNNPDELSSKVVLSLENAIVTIPRRGWEPALPESNEKIFNDNIFLISQNIKYCKRIKDLEKELTFFRTKQKTDYNADVTLKGIYKNNGVELKCSYNITLKKVLLLWYPHILDVQIDIEAKQCLEKAFEDHLNINNFVIDEDSYCLIKSSLSSMGVIAEFSIKKPFGISKHIIITDYGKKIWSTFD